MPADLATVDGFLVAPRPLPVPIAAPSDSERAAMIQALAAMLCGETPEDAAESIEEGSWPRPVFDLLARPGEFEELAAWVDVLLVVRERAAAGEG